MTTTRQELIGTRFPRNGKTYEVSGYPYANVAGEPCVKASLVKDGVRTNYSVNVKVAEVVSA